MTIEVATALPAKLDWFSRRAKHAWSWLPEAELEANTREQVEAIGSLPCAVAVAVMPDCHFGYGMPIGSALATENAVVPNAVGVDIGCGMVAARLGNLEDFRPHIRAILEGIYKRVPVGQPTKGDRNSGSHAGCQNSEVLREWEDTRSGKAPEADGAISWGLREKADRQLGTLGGGNHFIELQADEQDNVWLMLHSGSRGFGYAIGTHYAKLALRFAERYHSPIPNRDLGFLSTESSEGNEYLIDMGYAMRFAKESREQMYRAALDSIVEAGVPFEVGQYIATEHNFASREKHFGRLVVVHRKGAVRTLDADGEPTLVTIPGSMQTGSYIGMGKANTLAMNTCAHGAGRKLGRKAMVAANPGADMRAEMAAAGIELVVPPTSDVLDEGGRAYKDIEDVMRYQADLVAPVVKLRPLGVVKG